MSCSQVDNSDMPLEFTEFQQLRSMRLLPTLLNLDFLITEGEIRYEILAPDQLELALFARYPPPRSG